MPQRETVRNLLRNDYKIQIDEIWRKAKEYHSDQRGDNTQGTSHCETVESSLYRLIPERKKRELKQISLFLLSAASCVHDIGKIDGKVWEEHGKRSMLIILDHYERLGLDWGQAVAVAYIVSVHDHGHLDELPRVFPIGNEEVDIIELAAIFRLADMLDTTYKRVPEVLSEIMFPDGNIPQKWRGRRSVTGWYLDRKNKIILQAAPKEMDDLEAVYTLWSMMNEEISEIAPHLRQYGYPYEFGELEIDDICLKCKLREEAIRQRPLPGMAFYTEEDADIFKGRDNEIEKLLPCVSTWPITLLIGETGAGKTSLIHAGLFPRLKGMSWRYVWTRPFCNPTENIKKMIWNKFLQGNPDDIRLLDVMRRAADKCKPHTLLVVIDQCEDVLSCNMQEILDDFSLTLMSVQTGTVIPNLRVLISLREDALVKLNARLLKNITGSRRQLPSIELEWLTREGAKHALLAGLENVSRGLDPRQKEEQRLLLEIILDDIQKGGDRLYPPYIQIVAEILCKRVDRNNPVITREMYSELGGADNIIAYYLMEQLNEFGSQREKAEKILIFLTSSTGEKVQKSLSDLSRESGIEIKELEEIMNRMVDLRMARSLGDDEFEIIHSYLSRIVDEKLVKKEDRTIKFIEEQLHSFYLNYKMYKTPIISTPFLALLYRNRKKIRIDEETFPLFLCTILLGDEGVGWYWLKDTNKCEIVDMIRDHLSHEMEDIRNQAVAEFAEIMNPAYKDVVIKMLSNDKRYVRRAAVEALGKIVTAEDKDTIIEMLHHDDGNVRRAAVEALGKIVTAEDKDTIIEMLRDEGWCVRKAALEALGTIVSAEDKDTIIEMLRDEGWFVRKAALEALGTIASPEDKEKLIEMFYDEYWDVREAAAKTYVRKATPEDKDTIIEMLREDYWFVRKAAVEALGTIAGPEDKNTIMRMFYDEDEDVQRAAKKVFLEVAHSEDKDTIIEMFSDESEDVRKAAVEAFSKMATPRDKDTIIEMLQDRRWFVRRAVVGALLKMATFRDKDTITEMFSDEDWDIRKSAKKTYLKMAPLRDAITEMFSDESEDVRKAAVEALGEIATVKDKDIITEMFSDESEDVRKAAVEAFLKIAFSEGREYLLDLLSDEAQGYGEKQINAFKMLSRLDRMFYCPYHANNAQYLKQNHDPAVSVHH